MTSTNLAKTQIVSS